MIGETASPPRGTGPGNRGSSPIESVRRALRVLRCFQVQRPELGVTEIARELRLPKSSVHRLLNTLEQEGFVHKLDGSRYALGWRALELGGALWAWNAMRQPVLRWLGSLVQETGETAHLGVLDRGEVLYIEKVESVRSLRMPSAVGRRVPLHCTALGKVLLAGLERDVRTRLLRNAILQRHTSNTITNRNKLLHEINIVRNQGFAIDREEIEEGLMCVAAPVVDDEGVTCSAISIAGPASRMTPRLERHAAAVQEVCASMSSEFGAHGRRLRELGTLLAPEAAVGSAPDE